MWIAQKYLSLYLLKTELMICTRDWETLAHGPNPAHHLVL